MTGTKLDDRASSFGRRSDALHRSDAAAPRDIVGLRLLVELAALRKLAERGLCDQELAVVRGLADATLRSARDGDVLAYRRADMAFHLCLLELTSDPALPEIARLVLAPSRRGAVRPEESGQLMAAAACEHCELVDLLRDDMLSAADDLLRHHISGPWAGRTASARGSPDRDPLAPKER